MRPTLLTTLVLALAGCGGDVSYVKDTGDAGVLLDRDDGSDVDADVIDGVNTPVSECPAFPPAAILVTAAALDGTLLCDAVVELVDGDFRAIAQVGGGQDACVHFAVFERAGIYDVTATRPGYLPAVAEGVVVTLDACGHAVTVAESVVLTPGALPPDPIEPPDDEPVDVEPEPEPVEPDPITVSACPTDMVVHTGDVLASLTGDLDVLDGVTCLEGTLSLGGDLSVVDLPDLERVTGSLVIDGGAIDDVSFASLNTVELDVTVLGTNLVDLAGFAALETVGGVLTVGENNELEVADLFIVEVGQLVVVDNTSLPRMRLRSLSAVGSVLVDGNPLLEDLDLRLVLTVDGDATFSGGSFADLDLRALTIVNGTFSVVGAIEMADFDQIDALETVGGALIIEDNVELTNGDAASFADAIDVAGSTSICGNAGADPCL